MQKLTNDEIDDLLRRMGYATNFIDNMSAGAKFFILDINTTARKIDKFKVELLKLQANLDKQLINNGKQSAYSFTEKDLVTLKTIVTFLNRQGFTTFNVKSVAGNLQDISGLYTALDVVRTLKCTNKLLSFEKKRLHKFKKFSKRRNYKKEDSDASVAKEELIVEEDTSIVNTQD